VFISVLKSTFKKGGAKSAFKKGGAKLTFKKGRKGGKDGK